MLNRISALHHHCPIHLYCMFNLQIKVRNRIRITCNLLMANKWISNTPDLSSSSSRCRERLLGRWGYVIERKFLFNTFWNRHYSNVGLVTLVTYLPLEAFLQIANRNSFLFARTLKTCSQNYFRNSKIGYCRHEKTIGFVTR